MSRRAALLSASRARACALDAGDVGVDGRRQARLAELAEHNAHEVGDVERGRPEGDQRLRAGPRKAVAVGPGDPLGQHRQRPAGLLELRQRVPLALKDRQRRRVEGIAGLEARPQMLARLRLRGGAVHQRPLRGKPLAPLEAPVGVEPGHLLPEPVVADVVEQPPPDHLAHLRLVVREQVLGDAPDDLGDLVLPRQIEIRHLDLAARQADDGRSVRRPRHRDGQVLDEGMEPIGHPTVAVDEVEHLVEQHQHGRAGRREHAAESLGARRRGRRVRAEQLDAPVSGELPGDVDPRRLPPLLRIPGVADEDRHPSRRRGQPRVVQQVGDLLQVSDGLAGRHQVIQGRQRVRLASAELRHQRHHRRGVGRLAREAPQHHPRVLAQRPREARAREERPGIA